MRRVYNPPNPFESAYHEYLEEPPPMATEVYEETARSIITRNDSPDCPFTYSVNPYRGCLHACAYCYARTYHEYLGMGAGTDFDCKLVAKVNAPELLRRELTRPRYRGQYLEFSGITDCYQPLEAVYGLTRRCLEVCRDMRTPAAVVTKSFLVVRDAELLAEIERQAGVSVCISIPFADVEMCRKIEPGAPSPARRFEAVRRLAQAGLRVGVLIAPIIPGLNDTQVPRILAQAAEAGARFACYTALRLPGSVEQVFLKRLKDELPLRYGRICDRIREMRDGRLNETRFGARMTGTGHYWRSIEQLFAINRSRYGLAGGMPLSSCPADTGACKQAKETQLSFAFAQS
ncbi:MAG: PA0069 family radical SAM protein [Phycisphaerae bacterium]|nr:PA0069 family radical SAM protein [Phycisphaerae bacterium]